MSNLVVIPGKMEDINKILNKDIKGIILGVKSLSIYPLELDIDREEKELDVYVDATVVTLFLFRQVI